MTTQCRGCQALLADARFRYCSAACKPQCSVTGCVNVSRKRGWCAAHYAQARVSGSDPVPFKHKWSELVPCMNCGSSHGGTVHRRFCTDRCRVAFNLYGGPRPTSVCCVACGTDIDLNERGKKGQVRKAVVKFCRPCKQDYNKYKLSAREIAKRDGTDCGICGLPVDMTLARSDGLNCPSVDHIMPRAHGGSHDPSNLQLAHLRCNMLKSDRVVVESGCK